MAVKQAPKQYRWWEVEGEKHVELFDTVRCVYNNNRERYDRNMRCLRLYGNQDILNFGPNSYLNTTLPVMPENRVKINIISSMVDTSGSKISKMKPKITFLTEGGDYSSQKQAKQLSKFMLGAFYMNKIHDLHQQAFRDGQIFDVGALKHYQDGKRIYSERVLSMELMVDPLDALYGKPKSLYQIKYVARSVLKKMFPQHETALELARDMIEDAVVNQEFIDQFVCVIEGWHLPSKEGAGDGRHVLCVGNHTLEDEEYTKDYFPFTFFRWSKPVVGFYGQSLAERLTSTQIEINKMLRIIQRSFHLGSAFKVFLEYGSKVAKEQLNNDVGSIIYYMGTKPEYYVPKTVHTEYFQHLSFLIQSAYEEAGISQLSASSRKPAGVESGKAIREYNDIESERFALVSQEYEATYMETARIYIDLAEDVSKAGGDFAVVGQSKKFIKQIKWSEVAPANKNAFIMQQFPTSMLPHEPAGRLAFVQELINGGMITPELGTQLLDFPDLESHLNLKNAAAEDLMATLEELIEGDFVPPEPAQDLQSGIPLFQSAYLRYKREGVSEEKLDQILQWISQADFLLEKAKATQRQPAPMLPVSQDSQSVPGTEQPQVQPPSSAVVA